MAIRKILYTASTEIHLTSFHLPYLRWFNEHGFEVHVAYNGINSIPFADKVWNISFGRSPLDLNNWRAYKKLKKIINEHKYELVHCHTPMASIVTRLSTIKSRNKGTKVLYTAHGFHFFKGGPIKNWLLFYPIEKFMSKFTDAIITINKEDFDLLYKKKFASTGKFKIFGIGLDPERLQIEKYDKKQLKKELLFSDDDFILLYIAEFIERKNHKFIIESIPPLINKYKNIKVLFAGGGILKDKMEKLAENRNIKNNVDFLGFRKDIGKYISITDIGISSSKQEGLGLGIAEIMYNGIPVVVSQDRGHRELVVNSKNGFVFEQENNASFLEYVEKLYLNEELRNEMGSSAKKSIEKFLIDNSLKQMTTIYKKYIKV